MSRARTRFAVFLACASIAAACGGTDDDDAGLGKGTGNTGGTKSGGTGAKGGGGPIIVSGGSSGTASSTGGTSNSASGGTGPYMVPSDFTKADDGGWKLGDAVVKDEKPPTVGGDDGCGSQVLGIVRDFKRGDQSGGHPDFETHTGNGETGLVKATLGDDDKPVFNDKQPAPTTAACDGPDNTRITCLTTKANFDQWYRDDPGVNDPYYIFFSLQPDGNGHLSFSSRKFFPLDGEGFGNQGASNNFGFTTEVHTTFTYMGGENFGFTGDDDLWVFINKKLAIDLGGLHQSQTKNVVLDDKAKDLGITKGQVYPLDLFHAERHSSASNFNIETTLVFKDCGVIVPSGPIK